MTSPRRLPKQVLFAVMAALLPFAVLEIGLRVIYAARNSQVERVPLPYVLGNEYGPTPPWLASWQILAPDPELIWRNRPHLQRSYVDHFRPAPSESERLALWRSFSPWRADRVEGSGEWRVSLNSEGFRDEERSPAKPPGVFRIVCLGDSWTFGMTVDRDQTYPSRLQALLRERFPSQAFEVWNRGVLGYSSYQGLLLLEKLIGEWRPDVVVAGFAMNDSKFAGFSDRRAVSYEASLPWRERLSRFARTSELFRLLEYWLSLAKFQPKTPRQYLEDELNYAEQEDLSRVYEWARVSPQHYRENLAGIIRVARRHGASAILVYNEFWRDGLYLQALREVARAESVPVVDSGAVLASASARLAQHRAEEAGLVEKDAVTDGPPEVVFRVNAGEHRVPRFLSVTGPYPELASSVPNELLMHDDGTHGDQRAGDGVWSLAVPRPAANRLVYVYTNSGRPGRWEGLDVPHIRAINLDPGRPNGRVYLPLDTFGEVYMYADSWHTNAEGYDLIAREVLRDVMASSRFREAMASTAARNRTAENIRK
jgi:lysophospholipase L1-like esterase